jgi:hypothetical protein
MSSPFFYETILRKSWSRALICRVTMQCRAWQQKKYSFSIEVQKLKRFNCITVISTLLQYTYMYHQRVELEMENFISA